MVLISLFTQNTFALIACALCVQGLVVPNPSVNTADSDAVSKRSNGFLKLDFEVTRTSQNGTIQGKRGDTESNLINAKSYYSIDLNFGSQAQSIPVILDTGSSDLWVVDKTVSASGFDSKSSSSYNDLGRQFQISYVGGTVSTGEWSTDTVAIPGGPSLKDFQFADVTSITGGNGFQPTGILGIFSGNYESNGRYPNFPVALKNAGVTNKVAYSIYLNNLQATTGSIIFGGIDEAKIDGTLVTLPFTSDYRASVALDGVTAPDGSYFNANGADAVLDTGTTISYLPGDIVQGIANGLDGATYDSSAGQINLSSCLIPQGKEVSFKFGDATIKVPLTELVFSNGVSCYLAIQSNANAQNINLFGDTFLRSAYVVLNFDEKHAQLAQVKYTTDTNIVAIN